jgi:hypothetical protein
LFWDNTNGRLGIGTSSPTNDLNIYRNIDGSVRVRIENISTGTSATSDIYVRNSGGGAVFQVTGINVTTPFVTPNQARFRTDSSISNGFLFTTGGASPIRFAVSDLEKMQINGSTGNVLINTTTDAGFKLDVNGTARVKDAGSELAITSPLASNAAVIFTTKGAGGGYRGGYNFKGGFGGSAGNTIFIIDTTNTDAGSRVGIGNFVFGDLSSAKVTIDNTQSGGRNAGLKLRANFADIITQYNGIQFDTIGLGNGGAFVGSQRNTAATGYGSDFVVLTTAESPSNTYVETARFIGRYNSFYVGTDKTLAVASAKMQVESTTQGFLPPRMDTTQKNAIASPAAGLMVYDTTLNLMALYNGTIWTTL